MSSPNAPDARWASAYHAPVLVAEVLDLLAGARMVLDGTLGGGGHAAALLESGATVYGLDRDAEALAAARERLAPFERAGRFHPFLGNFASIDDLPSLAAIRFDGILLDLGVSSHQLDDPTRGFTYREGAPLDMRMSEDASLSASTWLSTAPERELAQAFQTLGDEPKARRLARQIVRRRERRSFETSDELVDAIRAALGPRSGAPDFARLFQAVRIVVNEELTSLEAALPRLLDRLVTDGRMAVIAYHSGEDRLVKDAFREWSAACICPPKQPVCTCRGHPLGNTLTRKPVTAGAAELEQNPRARSARLRAWRRAG